MILFAYTVVDPENTNDIYCFVRLEQITDSHMQYFLEPNIPGAMMIHSISEPHKTHPHNHKDGIK